jgi:uncharacterized SAM-binding protein YcdF (DUF218 family)
MVDKNQIEDFNKIIEFLARQDIAELSSEELVEKYNIQQVDLIIILGNCIPFISIEAGKAYKNGIAKELMIAGGVGHVTQVLRDNINEKYPDFRTIEKSETDIIAKLLEEECGIKTEEIMLDNKSTNCGENARNALKVVKENKYKPKTVLLMQDPTMQQRIDACFKKEWKDEDVNFINYAAFIPYVKGSNGKIEFVNDNLWGIWKMEHFLSLVLGEIPRLLEIRMVMDLREKTL